MKKGYIKLIAAVILGIAIIGGGIYGVYTLLSSNTTTILYRSTVDDKINAIRPYIVALDSYNAYSVAYANQLQPTLEELRNGSHNTTITLPKYKDLKTALEAAKQSKRSIVPKVTEPIGFEEVLQKVDELDLFLVPYENANNFGIKTLINKLRNEEKINNIKNIGIFVGPEGGIEEEEIEQLKEKGAHIVTLGKRILRTETAGFVATSLIQYELSDLGGND